MEPGTVEHLVRPCKPDWERKMTTMKRRPLRAPHFSAQSTSRDRMSTWDQERNLLRSTIALSIRQQVRFTHIHALLL